MTNLRDILNDFTQDLKKVAEKAKEEQQRALDDELRALDEIEEEMTANLVDEYIETIKNRIVG